jgi:hypothetical protein
VSPREPDCGHDHQPHLYDVERARAEMAKGRRMRDPLTREQANIGDRLAHHLNDHFSAEELETAGRAVMIAAASIGTLAAYKEIPGAVLVNILAFAGDRLITDGRVEVPHE